jgi:dolichyl-phosphate-mannose--protein O-mannosyl transferase
MKASLRYTIVFVVSLTILILGISKPPRMFDEPSYVGAARNFIAGTPTINPEHPPLAKYFIALSIKLCGDNAFAWRFPSALSGSLLAFSLFGLTFSLTGSWHTSYIAWLLTIANGFWFVMSRIATLTIVELAFEAAAVWAFTVGIQTQNQTKHIRLLALSGALFGLSIGCRWSGVIGLLVCVAYALFCHKTGVKSLATMVGVACAIYAASWIPLLIREHQPARYLLTANLFIFEFHRHPKGDPRLGEAWWSWIFRIHPQPALSYLVGNPVVAILGLVAIFVLLWQRKPLLPALYIAHVMQWVIAIKPLTFYYYYFEAFTWLTVALAIAMQGATIRRVRLDVIITACVVVVFAHWYVMFSLPG